MNKFDFNEFYRQQIKIWSNAIEKKYAPEDYYQKFIEKIFTSINLCITYDEKIVDTIITMLKSYAFQVYTRDPFIGQNNPRRSYLFQIIEVLYSFGFIDKHNYYLISLHKQVFLQDKLRLFLEICGESDLDNDQIENNWEMVMEMDMVTFWNFVQQNQIKDWFLIEIYQKVCKCNPILNDESTLNFIQSIKRKYQDPVPVQRNLIRIPSNKHNKNSHNQRRQRDQLAAASVDIVQRASSQEYYKKQKTRLYEELWFNKLKYKKYQIYMNNINRNCKNLDALLNGVVFEESLFYHERHEAILTSIFYFIEDVQKCLDNNRIISYQFFGSIRSTLALASDFDIDLTSIRANSYHRQMKEETREMVVDVLFAIRRTLMQSKPQWLQKCLVYHFEKIKVPFLKIEFNKQELIRSFNLHGIEKMDITIGNKSAIKNSEMISYFARVPQITCFCLLVKLWAKTNSVINTKTPMKGLSSYGVILMCLYYLMWSSQIDFLYAQDDFDIESMEVTPNFDTCNIKGIEENFCGFLNFYKQTGYFQRERKVVCLLKNCRKAAEMFDDDIVFNMYDFMDKSNPGRLRYHDKYFIFEQIDKAIKTMKTKDLTSIRELITGNV